MRVCSIFTALTRAVRDTITAVAHHVSFYGGDSKRV